VQMWLEEEHFHKKGQSPKATSFQGFQKRKIDREVNEKQQA
jgi:hypothetical protein